MCVMGEEPIQGLNAKPDNCTLLPPLPFPLQIRMWTGLGVAFGNGNHVTDAMSAFEEAISLSIHAVQTCHDEKETALSRREGCSALANSAWLCLHMSKTGMEWKNRADNLTVADLFQTAMKNLFHEAIQGEEKVTFGAGTLPPREEGEDENPNVVLLACLRGGEEERFVYYDEELCAVREWKVEKGNSSHGHDRESVRAER